MKSKINAKLILIAFLAILVTALSLTFVYYNLLQKQIRSDLVTSAKLLKNANLFVLKNKVPQKLISQRADLRITWIDTNGKVLYDNDVDIKSMPNHLKRPEISAALKVGEGAIVRESKTLNENTYYYALRLDDGTILRVASNGKNLLALFLSAMPIVLLLLLIIIGICIGVSHFLTRQLVEPIEILGRNLDKRNYSVVYKELKPFVCAIRKQHAEVLAASKARQDFTANVSHELKTPLTAIIGYIELLENKLVDESKKQHFYREIRRNCNRLLLMIEDIIKLAEIDQEKTITFSEVNLCDLAKECCAELRVNAETKNIKLSFKGEMVKVQGNHDLLKEMLENLIQNSIRYNNEGGSVWVEVKRDNSPTLSVKDNGIGIESEEQKRIFERFYRVDKSRSKLTGGTGLGLAIVKHIVEIHNAKIEVTSLKGEGTTMTIIF